MVEKQIAKNMKKKIAWQFQQKNGMNCRHVQANANTFITDYTDTTEKQRRSSYGNKTKIIDYMISKYCNLD